MIISRTPFRISFFGGGTDYPSWYEQHGGKVLATSIDKYCYITCRHLPPFFEHRIRVVYSKIENCQTVDEIQHPAVREVLRYLKIQRGVEIHHDGDLPARSGMGSSSSFTVGLLHACYALNGQLVGKHQLATQSIHLEQNILKETVGSQDQVLAAYGGFNRVLFTRNGEISVQPITLSSERLSDLESHLMLFYTRIKRTASSIANTYTTEEKMNENKRNLRILGQMVDEATSILNSEDSVTRFGELLHEAWQHKRSLSHKVSNPEIDNLYEHALAKGAIGGKLLGAGGGGFLLLFVPPEKQEKLIQSMSNVIHVPFNFEPSGSQIIFYDREQDYRIEEQKRDEGTPMLFRELEGKPEWED